MADVEACCVPMFWVYLVICVGLVMFAGLLSGLTLGLMSLSLVDLEVLVKSGRPQDRANAARILPVVKNQHLLLCTLLIGNALAMEALPIFLDALVPAWGAILLSVTLILIFGEIIPQAVCSRYGLKVGAKLAGVVRLLLLVFFPIAYPISKLLDLLLGKGHFALLRRAELKTLVDMHGNEDLRTGRRIDLGCERGNGVYLLVNDDISRGLASVASTHESSVLWHYRLDHPSYQKLQQALPWISVSLSDWESCQLGKGGELTHDETTIISGALDLTQKTAKDAMTTISETFSLDINSKLDMNTMGLIMSKGHSRVPIYSGAPTNIIGLILVKNLLTCRPEDEIPIRNVTIRKIPRVCDDMPLYDILNEFQKGHSHMAVVVKSTNEFPANFVKGMSNMVESRINKNRKHSQADGSRSPLRNMDQQGMRPPFKKWERGRHGNIIDDLDSLPSYPSDKEAVGIITMEDLMEELLQEEILDETDEYVDVHNKIRINMLPPRKLSPRSPGSVPHFQRRASFASPLSPYNHTSISRSPVSPSTNAPGPTPTRSVSTGKSLPSSPAEFTVPCYTSPPSHTVSRNTQENHDEREV